MSLNEKRPSEELEPSSKRIKLDELSEEGPLTQEDVTYFKKEAIWRQMQFYKREVNKLTREMTRYRNDIKLSELKIATLDTWYGELISLFKPLVDAEVDAVNENLLLEIDDDKLVARRDQLLKVVTSIVNKIPDNINLQQLSQELATLTLNNKQLSKTKHDLLEKVEDLQQELHQFTNKQLRQQSITLKRVNTSVVDQDEPEKEVAEVKPENKPESPITVNTNSTQPTQEEVNLRQDEIDELNAQVQQLTSSMDLLTQQVASVHEKNLALEQAKNDLQNKLEHLDELAIISSVTYKSLMENYESTKANHDKLDKINQLNQEKLTQLDQDLADITKLIRDESNQEIELLTNQLAKLETDLVRIRTIRDELLSKNTILNAELETGKTNDELNKLNKIFLDRIEFLEQEKRNEEGNDKLQQLSHGELVSQVVNLSDELKQIESAFKDVRQVSMKKLADATEQQNLVKKLNVEKTKADQKYFAAMRLKDAISQENKILKIQIDKSQEMNKNLADLEKSYVAKISLLEQTITDYKTIKQNSINEVAKLQEQNKALNNWKLDKTAQLTKLQTTINDKIKHVSQLQQDRDDRDATINKLTLKLKSTESLLLKYKTNNTSLILAEDEQQIEALRSIAKCSVCSKNWKDTVITVCGHVFCNHCTQERLAARLRRCPSCNKGFSSNDLLSIHL